MTLAGVQEIFWAVATRAEGFEQHDPGAVFTGSEALDAASRMEIYANMFTWRQIDVLREDYPKLASLMGAEAFYALGESYTRAHPSTHHSLSQFGCSLASFLQKRPGARPDLADMATLEWARAEVFEEAVVPLLSLEGLREMARGDFASESLSLVPAFRMVRLEHDILDLWQRMEEELQPSPPQRAATFAAVWRKEHDVFHCRLEPHEARAIERVIAGQPVALVCEAFEDLSNAADAALRALTSWVSEGWIAASRSGS
jgi:hypothetical protein